MTRSHRSAEPAGRRLLAGVLRRLRRVGIRIEPFLTVREGERPAAVEPPGATITGRFLDATDIDSLVALSAAPDANELGRWFDEGKLCYGLWDGARVVARMWCDLEEFHFPPVGRTLDPGEVYLFAAYADPEYRGRNLAPYMRSACYAALREQGYTTFTSYTEYFNTAARRFKAKLGARDEALHLHVDLWGLWSKTLILKRYP